MSKPDDIPQDVWDAARNAFAGYGRAGEYAETVAIYERIARTILAAKAEEREACAQLAESRFTLDTVQKTAKGHPYATGAAAIYAAGQVAAAIRKRGEG